MKPALKTGRAGVLGVLLAAGVAVFWASCAGPESRGRPGKEQLEARVLAVNHTDYEWRLEFRPTGANDGAVAGAAVEGAGADAVMVVDVPARGSREATLDGGIYRVRVGLVAAPSGAPEPRVEEIRLEAGRVYTWPLGTLLAEPER